MTFQLVQSEEMKTVIESDDSSFDIVFKSPTALDLLKVGLGGDDKVEAMVKLLCSNFIRFDGNVDFEDVDGSKIEIKSFEKLINMGGSAPLMVLNKSLEMIIAYINTVKNIEKK